MSEFIITCCSTADMSRDFFQSRNVQVEYFHFTIDGKEYDDDLGESIPFDKFYERIRKGATPTTSQVNPEQYVDLWEPALSSGTDVLHITFSSGLSSSYSSACIAKESMVKKYPERKLYIVDSLGACSGYGLLVEQACDLRDSGKTIDEIYEWLGENKLKVQHWFFSTDLTSYYRGGRISKTAAIFGTAFKICPLMNVSCEGKLVPRNKYRGKKKVIEEIVKRMEAHAEGGYDYSGKCYIAHSDCIQDAQSVAALIEEKFNNLKGKIVINSIGTVIGSHTGPETVALFFMGDMRVD